ncbi:MAG: argininosuccinate lyase [Candidatus Rokuibacteriota bacterium]|nr:MAG: argininosuccinate lyase [Candidatus Rokubacteria bacterium]
MPTEEREPVDVFRRSGGRLREALDPDLKREFYPGPWEHMRHELVAIHAFDKAHCLMPGEEGIIPRDIGRQLLRGLREMEQHDMLEARRSVGASHHSGELWLTQRLGEAVAGWLHVGRSSGDLGAVAWSITARAKVVDVWERVLALRAALLRLASEHTDTLMPGYSGAQHAQPITFGFYLHSWEEALGRDTERLEQVFRRLNRSPAGAAIMTGSDFPLNRHRVGDLLGYGELRTNCHDAIFHWDPLVETASGLTLLMANVSRIADDFHLWATHEFAMADLPDRYCITSSIMPQKKNPWSTVFIRGQSARVQGRMGSILAMTRTRQDEFDPHVIVPWELWEMAEAVLPALDFTVGTLTTLRVNRARMEEQAGAHWATATDLAATLVRKAGVPWRTAHQITAVIVRVAHERNIRPGELTSAMIDEAASAYGAPAIGLDDDTLRRALDPREFIARRRTVGGPASETLRHQLSVSERVLHRDQAARSDVTRRLEEAARRLESGIDAALA